MSRSPVGGRLDRWLVLICLGRFFSGLIYMVFAARLPDLLPRWSMSATEAGIVQRVLQAGWGVSLITASMLADRIGARRVLMWSAVATGAAALLFALLARSFVSAAVLQGLVGLSQGGTYAPAIMLIADRYPPERRGAAMGWLLASGSLSYAAAMALTGAMLSVAGYEAAFAAAALGACLAVVFTLTGLRGVPNVVHPREHAGGLISAVLGDRRAVILTVGYTAHTYELLGAWAWTPAFLAASLALAGITGADALGATLAIGLHVMGFLAAATTGRLSDRFGRRAVLVALAALGAIGSLGIGWLIGAPAWVIAIAAALYGFAIIGDSPVLSTAISEYVPKAHLGSALALRSITGFAAGAAAPLIFGAVLDATNSAGAYVLWGFAFASIGVGGIVATVAAMMLPREARSRT